MLKVNSIKQYIFCGNTYRYENTEGFQKENQYTSRIPKVSIVIRTYFRSRILLKTLRRICSLEYPKEYMEILVVADPEDYGAKDVLKIVDSKDVGSRVQLIECPVNSASACRNLGLLKSSGDIVAIIDDDVYVDALILKKAIEYLLRDHNIACVCYPVVSINPSLNEKLHHWRFLGVVTMRVYTVFPITICWKNILLKVGLYREDMGPPFSLHEDWELGSRIRAYGYKILVDGTLNNLHLLDIREEKNLLKQGKGSASYLYSYVTKHWKTFFEVMKVSPLSQKIEYLFYFVFPILALMILLLAGVTYFISLLFVVFFLVTLNSFLRGYYSKLRFVERFAYPSMLFVIRVLRTYLSVAGFVLYSIKRVLGIR